MNQNIPDNMDIDDVYRQIGEFGKHQKVLVFCLVVQHAYVAFHMIHMVFVGAEPDIFFCQRGNTLYKNTCPSKEHGNCTKFEYKGNSFSSIATEVGNINLKSKNSVKTCIMA